MCRSILLTLVLFFVLLMAGAALAVQEYGWPGFLGFLAGLLVLGYLGRQALPQLFAYLLTRPLRKMAAGLRGARIMVHSVTPCDPPPAEEWDPDEDPADDAEERPRIADRWHDEEPDPDEAIADVEDGEAAAGPLDWYLLEFSVVPPDAGSCEGRIAVRRGWMPQMVGAVGPPTANPFRGWPPADQSPSGVQFADVELWTGSAYEPPGEDEVFGEQRLRLRAGVTRDVRAVTITYVHFTHLGEVRLPRIDVTPGHGP